MLLGGTNSINKVLNIKKLLITYTKPKKQPYLSYNFYISEESLLNDEIVKLNRLNVSGSIVLKQLTDKKRSYRRSYKAHTQMAKFFNIMLTRYYTKPTYLNLKMHGFFNWNYLFLSKVTQTLMWHDYFSVYWLVYNPRFFKKRTRLKSIKRRITKRVV